MILIGTYTPADLERTGKMAPTPRRKPPSAAPSMTHPPYTDQAWVPPSADLSADAGRYEDDPAPDAPRRLGIVVFATAVIASLVSAAALFSIGRWEDGVRFTVVTLAMLAPLVGEVPVPFFSAFAAFVLFATWAAVQHWYEAINRLDVVVHVLTPGSLAAVLYFVLASHRLQPDPSEAERGNPRAVVLAVTLVGTGVAVVWELYEWVMEQVSPQYMRVGYSDTVGDLLAGMVGSMLAGAFILWWLGRQTTAGRRDGGPAHG